MITSSSGSCMTGHMDSIPSYHTPNEMQQAAVPELQIHQFYQPP